VKAFSATEIVYHMVAVEQLWQTRISDLLADARASGSAVVHVSREFTAMNPDEDAATNSYNTRSFENGLQKLREMRINTLAIVGRLADADFRLAGIHSRYGELSIDRMLQTMENHDRQHAAQLERTVRELTEGMTA
jgi:hypothetical protein